jgi:serine/threonine protein kinase
MSERDIFTAALQITDPAARCAYLEGACADTPALRERVNALLRAHEQPDSLLDASPSPLPDPSAAATRPHNGPDVDPDHEPTDDLMEGAEADVLRCLAPPGRPDSLGRIGHYEVLGVVGHGGFGVVFRAMDVVLQRIVAVKVLASRLAATSPARKRFLREARSSAQVRHENVVQVYAIEEQPLPYLVMEFIPGETLQQRLDRTGPLEVPEVLRIGRQIAEGLAAAHAMGLIHRDVKPANVMIERGAEARVKLTDFGLARATDDARISQSGVVAGTPLYMAPEQARGEALDHRADLFSLGSVLYVMCTGRPPFRANSALGVLKRVAEDEPRPMREVIADVPVWLCRIVEKLHDKSPAARYQSAREVADVLADCESQVKRHGALRDFSRIPGGQLPRSRRKTWVAEALAFLLLLAAVVWCGPFVWRYLTKTSEIQVVGDRGLTDVIVHKDGDAVTDWFDPIIHPTVSLPPGNYKLEPGFGPGRTVDHWEITTHGLFSGPMLMQFKRAPEFEVGRGEWVTIRAVMRDAPIGDVVPKAAPGLPDAAALRALRDQLAAKERILETAKIKEEAGSYSRVEVVEAEIALTEARTRLAEAEENQERVCKLMEDLLTQLEDQRRLTAAKVEAGRDIQQALVEVDARITEAKNRLNRARSTLPPPAPPDRE